MKQILYTLVLSIFISCCQSPTTNKAQDNQAVESHVDDQFANDAFGFSVTVDNLFLKLGQFRITRTPINNNHNFDVIDTIYYLTTGNTAFEIYRAKDKDLFVYAYIDTSSIILKNNIKVGMKKADFESKFGISRSANKIEIVNDDYTNIWTFIFKDDRLSKMEYSGYCD